MTDDLLDVRATRHGAAAVLSVRGDLDAFTSPKLAEAISTELAGDAPTLIVDLSELDFLGSAGMTVLVAGHDAAVEQSKRFGVVANGPKTSRAMELVGLHELLHLHRTLEAALAAG